MDRVVRIAVVGDPGVGKTSLITSAATDTFSLQPPPMLAETKLAASLFPENVPMILTDTSSKPEDRDFLEDAIKRCDVVVLCFDSNRRDTILRVRTYWMPELQKLKPDTPVVLVSCKMDQDDRRESEEIRELVEPIVMEFRQVEVCINCSAARLKLVLDVFYIALKAVLYPMGPLYDRIAGQLTPNCTKALKRIFMICDTDEDDALDDDELNAFQVMCFNTPLAPEELKTVKEVVRSKMPQGVNERGLTLPGFIFLHALFIERSRLESTWAVMRKFGYNDELKLSDSYLGSITLAQDQVWELSETAEKFLRDRFEHYDTSGTELLRIPQLQAMFETSPATPAWQEDLWSRLLVGGDLRVSITWSAFLTKWRAYTLLDPAGALAQLLYLGYNSAAGSNLKALLTRQPRQRTDKRTDASGRRAVHCFCFGAVGSGCSSLVKAVAGRKIDDSGEGYTAATTMKPPSGGPDITVIMTKVTPQGVEEMLAPPPANPTISLTSTSPSSPQPAKAGSKLTLAQCDVAAFVFDSSSMESLQVAKDLLVRVSERAGRGLPCVLVASKDDLVMSQEQQTAVQQMCEDLRISRPLPCSSKEGVVEGVLVALAEAARHPEPHIPDTPARKAQRSMLRNATLAASSLVLGGVTAYLVYRVFNGYQAMAVEDLSQATSGSSSSSSSAVTSPLQGGLSSLSSSTMKTAGSISSSKW